MEMNRTTFWLKLGIFFSISGLGINLSGFLTSNWTCVNLNLPLLGNRSYHLGLFTYDDAMKNLKRLQREGQRMKNIYDLFGFSKFETSNKKGNGTARKKFSSRLLNLFHLNHKEENKAGNSIDRNINQSLSKMTNSLLHTFKYNHSTFQEPFLSHSKAISKLFSKNITNKIKHYIFGRSAYEDNDANRVNVSNIHQTKHLNDPVLPAKSGFMGTFKGIKVDCVPATFTEELTMDSLTVVLNKLPDVFKQTKAFCLLGELAGLLSIIFLAWYTVRAGTCWVYHAAVLFTTTAGCSTFFALFVYFSEVPGCLSWSFYLCASSVVLYVAVDVVLLINMVVNRKKDKSSRDNVKYFRLVSDMK